MEMMEDEVRDECFEEMTRAIENERRRWQGAWDAEADRKEGQVDRKIELLSRGGVAVWEDEDDGGRDTDDDDDDDDEERHEDGGHEYAGDMQGGIHTRESGDGRGVERVGELEKENGELREKVLRLERETLLKTPFAGSGRKQRILRAKRWDYNENVGDLTDELT